MTNDGKNISLANFLSAIQSDSYLTLSNAITGNTAKKPVQPLKRRGTARTTYDLALYKEGNDNKKFLRFFERRLDFGGVKNNAYGGVVVEPFVISSGDESNPDGDEGVNAAVAIYHKKKKKYLTIDKRGDFKSTKDPIPLHVETYQDPELESAPVVSEDDTTVEENTNQQDSDRNLSSYEIFLKAVESKSFLQLSTILTVENYSARLLVKPVLHSVKNDVKLYSFGKDSTAKERFLRLFRWNDQMVNFDGDLPHDLGGMVVQPWCPNDDDDRGKYSRSAITVFNEKLGVYLSINNDGMFVTSKEVAPLYVKLSALTAEVNPSVLSEEEKEHFKTQGYIILRQAIPKEFIDAARHNINWQIGTKGKADTKHFPTNLRARIINHSPILWSALNILLGHGNIEPWTGERRFQIAMRYPHTPYHGTFDPKKFQREYARPGEKRWHIDCAQCECPFTLLVGVALSDQTKEGSGCLYVYPGTHLTDQVREYKEDCLGKDKSYSDKSENKPMMGEPVPVYLEKGDVVLAHAMLPHTASDNVSDDIRYQLFYRVQHMRLGEIEKNWMNEPNKCFMV